ncbi:helix-turn-helix domain-containing protein [Agromyces seonyuensis]|uniref:Helix-turn-helix domain-containing protein n=1 Tax=Agromyces seonyuensis TaxID=2662446 RepID=A0A6I4P815_9MICO|nr:helix-turn-helix transcriptional regulator [Agromyces seonyuensis]MWB99987.1 helix-turn-helix domain-containing protein [Agromyces seonyuensis]
MTSSTLVRAARKSRRLTQVRLAELTGVDQASVSHHERGREAAFSTVDRLLAGTGHRLYAAPTRRDDAASAAASIRASLKQGDSDRALRALLQLNDDLVAEHGLVRGVLGLTEPESTGSRVWDAALAALVAWRLGQERIPQPPWVEQPERFLPEPTVFRVDPADPAPSLSDVPDEFAERGVLAWADTFASV